MKKIFAFAMICSVLIGWDALSAVRSTSSASGRRVSATAQSAAVQSDVAPVANQATPARSAVRRGATTTVKQPATNAVVPAAQKSGGVSARAAALNSGTKITGPATNVIVSEECKEKYYGCMDSFCMLDNANGGRCLCSNRIKELDKVLADIQRLDEQSYAMVTTGVDRINLGGDMAAVNAMIDDVTKSITSKNENKQKARTLNLDAWNNVYETDEDDIFGTSDDVMDISNKSGDDLHAAVSEICVKQIPECTANISMLKMMYAQQIRSDCVAYENSLKKQKNESAKKLQTATKALQEAALEQERNQNKYDLGQCTVRFKQCMQTTADCGEDFSKCATVVADASASAGNKKTKIKDYKIKTATGEITIAASTYDTLLSKKPICESVTKQCVREKNNVWNAFLAEAAKDIKSAELIAESNVRMNCIGNISQCFQKACKDTMDPNDPDGSYDMCLTRPGTMLNLCKVQLNACGIDASSVERAEKSEIWGYVVTRLASMRVDSCTKSVKSCLTDENRCGADYSKCIGLDLAAIREMCPLEKLVGCQKNGQAAAWETIDNLVQGIYMDIDNSMLNNCTNLVKAKMVEICGDGEECAAFDNDEFIGADSLLSSKARDGSFVIDGLLTFGNVKIREVESTADNVKFGKYELDISDYYNNMRNVEGTSAVKDRVLATLQSVQNKINQKIALLTSDTKIGMCINGRDMKQIRGRESRTEARYPNLLDSSIMNIINAGLEKASRNYSEKYNEMLADIMEQQGDEKKAALCAAMAQDKSSLGVRSINFANVVSKLKKDSGISGSGYEVRHIIDGMTFNELLAQQRAGKGEFVQKNADGDVVAQIVTTATYSTETNTCTLTINTTVCEGMESVYNKDSQSYNDFFILGGGGQSYEYSEYQETRCTKMGQPVIKTEEIKM